MLRCLRCGHRWTPYKLETRLSWRQCPKCRSYSIIDDEVFESIVEAVLKERNPHGKRLFPILGTLQHVLEKKGITFRPLQTFHLAIAVETEVIKRLKERGIRC